MSIATSKESKNMVRGVFDYCIIGAGLAGGLLAHKLTMAGKTVVIIDAGPRFDIGQEVDYGVDSRGISPYVLDRNHPAHLWYEDDSKPPYPYEQSIVKGFGGSTLAWLGTAIRLIPDDFQMHSRFGVGVDWPLRYQDLEEHYQEAEVELGVAGSNDNPWLKGIIYPLPSFMFDEADEHFIQACRALNIRTHSTPQARNSKKYGGYPECDVSASCIPYCPSGAKYTALRHLLAAEQTGLLRILTNAPVIRLSSNRRSVLAAEVYSADTPFHVQARDYVVAAHTIESIRLLLLSSNEFFPNGLANSSGLLGRYFMDHPTVIADGTVDVAFQQKGFQALQSYQFYATEHRSEECAFKLEFSTSPQFKWQKRKGESVKGLKILALLDVLPSFRNQLSLSRIRMDNLGLPAAKISIELSTYEKHAMLRAQSVQESILKQCGASKIHIADAQWGVGHQSGGCRMSQDSAAGIVDENLKAHDLENLYVVGSSVFPTIGAANPSLTIAALALRLSQYLLDHRE